MGRVFQDNLHSMLSWFLSPKSTGLELDGKHAVRMLAMNIALGYGKMEIQQTPIRSTTVFVNELEDEEYLNLDVDFLAPIIKLKAYVQKEIKDFLIDFLVHGSLATMDYAKGWSDFDTYLVIKKEIISDVSALVTLREKLLNAYHFLLDIDKLQHHGFLLCTEYDLEHYPSTYMPTQVLELSKSFVCSQAIPIRIIDTSEEEISKIFNLIRFYKAVTTKGILEHHAYKGEYLLSGYRNAENGMYQLKYLLNNVTLAPSYFFGVLGEHTYKRDGIERIKPYLGKQSLETLEKVTYIRLEWQNREEFPTKNNQIPRWVREIIGPDYFRIVSDFMEEIGRLLEKSIG